MRGYAGALAILIAGAGPVAAAPDAASIESVLDGTGTLDLGGRALDRAALEALYQPREFKPIWDDSHEQSFLRALEEADTNGLDPARYAVASDRPADRELLLTDAFLRYASALARGRVSPDSFESDWRIASPAFDPVQVLDAAIAGDVATVLGDLAPQDPAYARLREALQHYRDLAATGWHTIWSPTAIQPGDRGELVLRLRRRLAAEDFAASSDAGDPSFYDKALAAAVSRFQAARGLPVDGSVGRLTLAALNVSPAARAREIGWNLERWRSLPRLDAATRIEVDVPAATATLYEDGKPARTMRAIVGAAVHPTPVLRARMNAVTFNPPWSVPASIIQKEVRPMLQRDPGYLKRFNFVYEDVPGGKHLVQLPGPTNSLGRIKFEMPNPDEVFMHDTPERALFALARRYISHGCVRIEDPRGLARTLLDSDQWSAEAIDGAIAAGATKTVRLKRTLPVYMLYWTAFVDSDGTIEFRDDVYGRDRRLAEALAARDAADHFAATADRGTTG